MRCSSRLALVAVSLAIAGCAGGGDCSSPYAGSPQFKGCLFANPPNPLTPPGASTWANWSRFLVREARSARCRSTRSRYGR